MPPGAMVQRFIFIVPIQSCAAEKKRCRSAPLVGVIGM
jgi:hypothetical protein